MEGAPIVRKENEGFTSYVVLPQYFDLKEFLIQRYKQERVDFRKPPQWTTKPAQAWNPDNLGPQK